MNVKKIGRLLVYLAAMGAATYISYIMMRKVRSEFQETLQGTALEKVLVD